MANLPNRRRCFPGGDTIVFALRTAGAASWQEASIVAQSLRTGERKILIERGQHPRYTATRHLIYLQRGTIFAVSFDATSATISAGSVPLIENVSAGSPEHFSVSNTGVLVYLPSYRTAESTLVWVTRDGKEEPLGFVARAYSQLKLSPDGRWMAYQSDETGEDNVFVRPFPNVDDGKWQVSDDGGTSPIWARDGSELFYAWREQAVMRVYVDTEPSFSASASETLFEGPYVFNVRAWDIAPEGERFIMVKRDTTVAGTAHVVLNWFQELKARVPPGN